MPKYVYRREDGSTFEAQQRITDDPLAECPTTGQPVTRIITSPPAVSYGADGFYVTDYGGTNPSNTPRRD